jgi:hypothetical protein
MTTFTSNISALPSKIGTRFCEAAQEVSKAAPKVIKKVASAARYIFAEIIIPTCAIIGGSFMGGCLASVALSSIGGPFGTLIGFTAGFTGTACFLSGALIGRATA